MDGLELKRRNESKRGGGETSGATCSLGTTKWILRFYRLLILIHMGQANLKQVDARVKTS